MDHKWKIAINITTLNVAQNYIFTGDWILYLHHSKMPPCTHLPDLLTNDGEYPEVQHILRDGWTRLLRLEVHQQHISKQQEEEEVHEDVAQKWGDRCKPELTPSWHYERTLRRPSKSWCVWREDYWKWIKAGYGHSTWNQSLFRCVTFKEDSPFIVRIPGEFNPCASASLKQ